ncbi:Ras-related protein Rab-38 [Stylophora pistillata]|uniref:Ras-related protein Rab-38 n=1 Tax=Stylophora pistillata TaxID=50429 RepID=A0A2B4RPZ4_STYPI|nr:Ras-related protein Rab-38 [Stylophora pistillata]
MATETDSGMASDAAIVRRDEEIFQEMKSRETDFTFKIMCLGDDTGFGKKGGFMSDYIQRRPLSFYHKPTIGVDFYLNFITWIDEATNRDFTVKLQFWDVAEHERFLKMTSVFCRNCVGALVFWGPKSPSPLGSVLKWSEKIKEANPKDANIPLVLIIENIPTSKRGKPVDWIGPGKLIENKVLLDEFCARNGFVGWFQLVSREGDGMATCVGSYGKPEEENKAVLSLLGKEIQLKSFKKNILENGDQLHLKIIISGDPEWKERNLRSTKIIPFCTPWLFREEKVWTNSSNSHFYTLKIQYWELSPIDRFHFRCGNRNLFKSCDGALLFFDAEKPSTLSAALQNFELIQAANPSSERNGYKVPIVLIMINNNVDDGPFPGSEEIVKRRAGMDKYCLHHGFATWFELPSCRTDDNKQVVAKAVNRILEEVIDLSRNGVTIWGDWKLKYDTDGRKYSSR